MIQLNLLPDIKQEYIKTERIKRLAISVSFIVTSAAIALLVIVFLTESWQKHTLGNLNTDVTNLTSTLKKEPDINSVLNVQSQLDSVNALHDKKPATIKLFDYLNELTPTSIQITDLKVDFVAHTVAITGGSTALSDVNQFVDTLKFTKYSTGQHTPSLAAFSNVILYNFERNDTSIPPVTFTINTNFDPLIFDITKNVSLVIPTETTTRSYLEHPPALFSPTSSNTSTNNGGH